MDSEKIEHKVTAIIFSDPISERTAKNRRNALLISGLSLLHFWNPIELTGFGFKLENGDSCSVSIILFALLAYLTITLILNSYSDVMESLEKIDESDEQETKANWHIISEWAKSLNGQEGDGPYRDPNLDSTHANIKAFQERTAYILELEVNHSKSVRRAKKSRLSRTIIVDLILPFTIIIAAFITHAITLTN